MKNKSYASCPNCSLKHQYITKATYSCKCGTKFSSHKKDGAFGIDKENLKQISVFLAPIALSAVIEILSQILNYTLKTIKFLGFLVSCVFLAAKKVIGLITSRLT